MPQSADLNHYNLPSSNSCFQHDNAPWHKAKVISNWFREHDNEYSVLQWPPQSQDLSLIKHHWDVVQWEIHIVKVQQKIRKCVRQSCQHGANPQRNSSNILWNPCHEELSLRRGPFQCNYSVPNKVLSKWKHNILSYTGFIEWKGPLEKMVTFFLFLHLNK